MSNKLFCNDCHIYFTRKQNLDKHLITKSHLKRSSNNKLFVCQNCQKSFTYCSGLSKHKNHCVSKLQESETITELIAEKEELLQKNEEMKKQIDDLLEKAGTTTVGTTNVTNNIAKAKVVNNTNNIETQININYYGCENLEYITDKFIQEMMKIPYSSIPHIIKHIHFHPAHPENHNIKITNRKLPYASVYKNDKWELSHKRQTIEQLMQKGYGLMDERIDNLEKLSDKGKERYQAFQNKFERDDPEALKQIYQATELCLLNGN